MTFASDEIRGKARALINEGKKPKEIVESLGGQCTTQDIHQLKFLMKKAAGGAGKASTRVKSKPPTDQAFKDAPPIVGVLAAEEQRLRNRITACENVLEVYGDMKKDSPFKIAVEEEIDRTNKRLDAIADLLGGYDDAIPLRLKA